MQIIDAGVNPIKCQCGAISYLLLEADQSDPNNEQLQSIACWRCASVIAQIPGVTAWSGETEADVWNAREQCGTCRTSRFH
jgi:hypothetical protein